MSYGKKLKNPGLKGKTPEGRTSWQDAQNQVEGNLRWALKFLSSEEVIAKLNSLASNDVQFSSSESLEERLRYLEGLSDYLEQQLEVTDREINRIQGYLAEDKVLNQERCSRNE